MRRLTPPGVALPLPGTLTWIHGDGRYQRLVHFSHTGYKNGVNWNRAAMSPDGGMVVAGGVTGALTVWNAEDGAHIATLKSGHSSAVVACSWGANDQLCSVEKVCCTPATAHLLPGATCGSDRRLERLAKRNRPVSLLLSFTAGAPSCPVGLSCARCPTI